MSELRVSDLLQVMAKLNTSMALILMRIKDKSLNCEYHLAGHYGKYILYYENHCVSIGDCKSPFWRLNNTAAISLLPDSIVADLKDILPKGQYMNVRVKENHIQFKVEIDHKYVEVSVTPRRN